LCGSKVRTRILPKKFLPILDRNGQTFLNNIIMVKKLLVFIMALGLALNASAQLTTIDPSDVQFWTGTGSNSTCVAIGWDDEDASYTPTVVIWGVRWEGSITLINALDTIAAYDERFSFVVSGSYLQSINYNDPDEGLVLTPSAGWNCNSYGGAYGSTTLNSTHLRISESTCDNYTFTGVTNTASNITLSLADFTGQVVRLAFYGESTVSGTDNDFRIDNIVVALATDTTSTPDTIPTPPPTPVDASLPFRDILYWVGEGSNEAVMAVNWADTALAWGYRWNGTATVADMMADIAAADPRFSYELGDWGIDDILFAVADGNTLRKVPYSYWESKNNGMMDMGMGQTLANGDFEKWAEPAAGVIVDSMEYGGYWYYTYVYPMTINPVSVPDTTTNPDGISDHEMSRVYAYPNPCTGMLYITNENAERIELYNANGKLLEAIENRDTQVTLNMQQYPAGLYLLKVGNGVQKILKK
jgi:hypothetical protein